MDTPCPADAPSAESGSNSYSLTLPSVAERSLVEAVHALVLQMSRNNELLSTALMQLSENLRNLTEVSEQMAALLAEAVSDDDDDEDALTYLDGSLR